MEIIEEFYNSETVRGLSEETLESWRYLFPVYFQYLDERQIPFNEVRREDAEEYLEWVQDRKTGDTPYSQGSLENFIKPVKAFYRYLEKRGIVLSNPFYFSQAGRGEKKVLRGVLKEKEMKQLLDRLRCFYLGRKREKISRYVTHLACELLYSTGMRIGELSNVLIHDIDLERKEILLRKTKNGHPRKAFLNEYAAEILKVYLNDIRPLLVAPDKENLFGRSKGSLRNTIYNTLKRACAEAGVKRIGCHGFRHAFGSHFLKGGCELRYIQKLLGHRAISSTTVYTKVEKEDLKKVLDTYHPRGSR